MTFQKSLKHKSGFVYIRVIYFILINEVKIRNHYYATMSVKHHFIVPLSTKMNFVNFGNVKTKSRACF